VERVRLRLGVEYDGTDFAGFQSQGEHLRTVQRELERALERVVHHPVRIHGAGRTDAGVHALGQVVHADVAWRAPTDAVPAALNCHLKPDLRVTAAQVAEDGFHARYSATGRTYRYTVLNRAAPSALLGRFVWHRAAPLDIEAMRIGAEYLVGLHDFAAFGRPDASGKSTVRQVRRCAIRRWRGCVLVTIEGNAFLRQMVRSIVGTLVEVGQGRLAPETVQAIRESGDRGQCPPIAPAQGLCLVQVRYDGQRLT